MLGKGTDRFEDPRDKRVTGESVSLANELYDQGGSLIREFVMTR